MSYRLYDYLPSGNGYKVRLVLRQLALPYELVEKRRNGHAALAVLEQGLVGRDFLVDGRYSLADIALYAYTHVAPEGGFSLDAYPAIRAWCARVAAQPGHVPITSR